jgi:hypothetical protein
MLHLPHSIGLHDSRIAAVSVIQDNMCVSLRPAYVHNLGKGWAQEADLIVRSASLVGDISELPALIDDGTARTTKGPYHNLLMLPLNDDGPVSLRLDLESGKTLTITGSAMLINPLGEPTYVEEFS